jgi:hypothetical protein
VNELSVSLWNKPVTNPSVTFSSKRPENGSGEQYFLHDCSFVDYPGEVLAEIEGRLS